MVKPEQHLGYFALYLSFFPKLLQGPIERAGDLIPQLKAKYEFDYDNIRNGLLLIAWGLFKKVVVADRLGLYVDSVYNDVHAFTGLPLLLSTYAYAFQIYMDFTGYTDIALGSARLYNIKLTQNFNSPYMATSVSDFWRRWHVSFSRWILDYIFEPLQMQFRNLGKWGIVLALVTTFIIAGIWHGASWTFVAFGLIHGIYLATSFIYKPYQKRLHKLLGIEKTIFLKCWQIFITFHLVCAAFVFFRSGSFQDAFYLFEHIPDISVSFSDIHSIKKIILMGQSVEDLKSLLLSMAILGLVTSFKNRFHLLNMRIGIRWSCYVFLALIISLLSYTAQYNFIYFQF
jgi:D-alanyl-lipoteichoic acid acyltransferase DltB (MBOAT superfamily)